MTQQELKHIIKTGEGISTEFIDGDIFSTIIYLNEDTFAREKTREKTREKILRLMHENSQITIKELADIIGISVKGIEYHIGKLKRENYLVRVGGDKGGKWKIIKH